MSNIVLNQYAHQYAEDNIKKFLAEYNSGTYTDAGKRELLRDLVFFAVLHGASITALTATHEVVTTTSREVDLSTDAPVYKGDDYEEVRDIMKRKKMGIHGMD